jgi:hypothetical protein
MGILLTSCMHTPSPTGLHVEYNGPIEGPGRYDIKIIVFNATLMRITCDNGVRITPLGPPEVQGAQEITRAILEIPPSFLEGMVTCEISQASA